MKLTRQTEIDPDRCGHPSEISIDSAGLTRTLCESCGKVRFQYDRGLSGQVERCMFARPADQRPPNQPLNADLPVRYAFGAVA